MKVSRAVAPFLILLLAGCAGPRLPWQGDDVSVDPIHSAYEILMSNYVDQPNPQVLLQAAYQGTQQALTAAGVKDAGVQAPDWTQGASANWDRFVTSYGQITSKYAKQVGSNKLEYAAINAMASALKDCQTHFYDPQATNDRHSETGGQQFGGIGVLMKNIPGHPTILRVLDGPAKSAGLEPGDEITAIDSHSVSGLTFEQVRNTIRGPQGSPVVITVKRPGDNASRDFTISRAQIQAPIIDVGLAANGSVGYIHLYSFPSAIPQEIDQALKYFDDHNVESIIFDVRANTGGDQQTILNVMSRFINGSTVEIQTDRAGNREELKLDNSVYWKNPKPLVVLADEDTQSGGEIFAKGMQEEGGYKVFGGQTAGCAASARSYGLSDGSSIEVSVKKVVSAKGDEINRVGVKPDQPVPFPVTDLANGRDPQLMGAILALRGVQAPSQPASTAKPAPSSAPVIKAPGATDPANILK